MQGLDNKAKPINNSFRDIVIDLISQIPEGKVTSYGAIAARAGKPRAARQVGNTLSSLSINSSLPWWRVVNTEGFLSIRGHDIEAKSIQKQLLQDEGINFVADYKVNKIHFL